MLPSFTWWHFFKDWGNFVHIKKIFFFLLSCQAMANITDFHSDEIDLIESLSVNNHNGIQINRYANGQYQFNGNQFIRLEISNNSANGYKVYATSSHGKLKSGYRSVVGNEIEYRIICDAYQTVTEGFTVISSGQVNLSPNVKTLIYNVNQPENVTDRAKPFCSLVLAPGEHLRDNFAGNYSDTINFVMETNDD